MKNTEENAEKNIASNAWDVCPQVADFKAYEAGLSLDEIREKYALKKVVKLASNENPFGVSPNVLATIKEYAADSFRYAQSGNPRLVNALATYYGQKYPYIKSKNIFVGNGSDEIIDLLFRVRCNPTEHNVVTFKPCFGLYVTQAKFHGCELRQAPLREDFSFDFDILFSLVDKNTRLVFVTNPDNPSGRLIQKKDLLWLAKALPKSCLLVIDEAYIEFVEENSLQEHSLINHMQDLQNVTIMRTFSKVYGLAGLRIGYAFLPEKLADYMWRVRLPFSVNILAQEAAIAALNDEAFKQKTIDQCVRGRLFLKDALQALGCNVLPSSANFIMFSLPQNNLTAKQFNEQLLQKGYIIRSLVSYQLPEYLRVSIGTDEQNTEFITHCQSILNLEGYNA